MSRTPAPRKWRRPLVGRGASAQQLAAEMLDAALAQASGNARGALESTDPEYVHQLRVGLRRYRSVLRVFRGLLRKERRRRLARRARALMAPLGEVRDHDLFVAWLERAKAPAALVRRARTRRDAARAALRPMDLSALRPDATVWKGSSQSQPDFRRRVLPKLRRKVMQRARRIKWEDAAQRHRLRIEVKRLRYATDFLGGGTQALEDLQETLGTLNDMAVGRRLLDELQPPAKLAQRLTASEKRLLVAARGQVAALEAED